MYAGRPYPEEYTPDLEDFLPHWAKYELEEDEQEE
jgi:hypothetical protein